MGAVQGSSRERGADQNRTGVCDLSADRGGKRPECATIYVLDLDHGVKVGMTKCGVESRIADFERGFGLRGVAFLRTWVVAAKSVRAIEACAHWHLRESRTVGEWFHCHPLEACVAVEKAIRAPFRYIVEQDREAA